MTTRMSAAALGAVGPYLVLGSLALSPGIQAVTQPTTPETLVCISATTVYRTSSSDNIQAGFSIELDRPDLMPNVIMSSAPSYPDTYEPFIIPEGWREEATLVGPFLVEEAPQPVIRFDDYDRATIDRYE
jgi:hypothetical protein